MTEGERKNRKQQGGRAGGREEKQERGKRIEGMLQAYRKAEHLQETPGGARQVGESRASFTSLSPSPGVGSGSSRRKEETVPRCCYLLKIKTSLPL